MPTEWDAATYHRVSAPQTAWGRRVLERLPLRGTEHVIDAGCGTGRLTTELLERLPEGVVAAVDRSANMLAVARSELRPRFGSRVRFVRADVSRLPFSDWADVVFSTATFHWVLNHPALFRELHRALKPGGLLLAQCGGGANLARIHARAEHIMGQRPFRPHFTSWTSPWEFATDTVAAERLSAAGFHQVEASLEPALTVLAGAGEYREFLRCVIMHPHLEYLPGDLHDPFLDGLVSQAAHDSPPFSLDYWRLNLRGRKR